MSMSLELSKSGMGSDISVWFFSLIMQQFKSHVIFANMMRCNWIIITTKLLSLLVYYGRSLWLANLHSTGWMNQIFFVHIYECRPLMVTVKNLYTLTPLKQLLEATDHQQLLG